MWRRVYFALMLVRIYLVFWPSYIHPDEQFQGPEVLAGKDHEHYSKVSVHTDFIRAYIWFSLPKDMGVDISHPYPECVPIMAFLRPTNGSAEVGNWGPWQQRSLAKSTVLCSPRCHGHVEPSSRRLGYL